VHGVLVFVAEACQSHANAERNVPVKNGELHGRNIVNTLIRGVYS
jgi:hypothetical protein